MNAKLLLIILVCLVSVSLLIGCKAKSTPGSTQKESPTSLSQRQQDIIALDEAFLAYVGELNALDVLTNQRLAEVETAMRSGELTMAQLYAKLQEIFFAEAQTIEFINNKPKYQLVHYVLWEDHQFPQLELNYDQECFYCDYYIALHHKTSIDFASFLYDKSNESQVPFPDPYSVVGQLGTRYSKTVQLYFEVRAIEQKVNSIPDRPLITP